MTEEEFCHHQLAALREAYLRDAQPYIDRLRLIEAMRPPRPLYLTADEAAVLAQLNQQEAPK